MNQLVLEIGPCLRDDRHYRVSLLVAVSTRGLGGGSGGGGQAGAALVKLLGPGLRVDRHYVRCRPHRRSSHIRQMNVRLGKLGRGKHHLLVRAVGVCATCWNGRRRGGRQFFNSGIITLVRGIRKSVHKFLFLPGDFPLESCIVLVLFSRF